MDPKQNADIPSTEFIDEAQSAVIKAVDNVSEMISETTKLAEFNTYHHYDTFYHNPEFWVGVAFVLVVIILIKPISSVVKSALTKRQQNIVNRINEAEKLRDDAQELLSQYERKFVHANDEVDEILKKSNDEIKNLTDFELQKMEKDLALKQKEVDMLIESSIEKTKNEISHLASVKAVNIAKDYIYSSLDRNKHEALIDNSIKNIINAIK